MDSLGNTFYHNCFTTGLYAVVTILSAVFVAPSYVLVPRSYGYWSKVKEHVWRQLKEGGSFQVEEVLSLSYNDLSPPMRECFFFLARYPEDHVIILDELNRLWIAEEFISEVEECEGVVMEDLAEDYLNELISRNLIQVEGLQLMGQVLTCRVHAISKAKEHKLLVVFDSSKHNPNIIHLLEAQPRHVIYNGIGEYLKLVGRRFDVSNLRSLALVNYFSGKVELKEMKLMYTKFKNLNFLDMRGVESDRIPEEIGELVHLQYLGLMGGRKYFEIPIEIPSSIGKLTKLQTLLGSWMREYIVPRELRELHELSYLNIQIRGILNIGSQQTKLHALGDIPYKSWIKIDTVNFVNLHTLSVCEYGEEGEEEGGGGYGYTLESIVNLTSLQKFYLVFKSVDIPTMKPLSSCNRLKSVYLMGTLKDPSELCFLPDSVTDLTLGHTEFKEDPMPTLGSLSNLTVLKLNNVYRGNGMVCSQNGFPSLQILRLNYFLNLEELEVGDGAFFYLKQYKAVNCEKLVKIPGQLERFRVG